jgi:hypothetical protein
VGGIGDQSSEVGLEGVVDGLHRGLHTDGHADNMKRPGAFPSRIFQGHKLMAKTKAKNW